MKSLSPHFQIADPSLKSIEEKLWDNGFRIRYSTGSIKTVEMNLPFLKDSEDFL